MPTLPTTGTYHYNGYDFPSETTTLRVNITPIETGDGRAFKGNRYLFHLRFWVLADSGSDIDDTMESLRSILTAIGGEFRHSSKGLGEIVIKNTSTPDLSWGPKPRSLTWVPKGNNRAAEVEWSVEFFISDCNDNPNSEPMEFVYDLTFSMGVDRLMRRTHKGHIAIPQMRRSPTAKVPGLSVDRFYELTIPPCALGFYRQDEQRTISPDRCRLDFSVTDVQHEVVPPLGVVPGQWSFSMSYSNITHQVFNQFHVSFSGRYKMFLHWPLEASYTYFFMAVFERLESIRGALQGKTYFPITFTARSNIESRVCEYDAMFRVVTSVPAFMAAGLWRPLPLQHNDEVLWAKSVQLAYLPRGYSQEIFDGVEDAIVDLCVNTRPRIPLGQNVRGARGGGQPSPIMPDVRVSCPPLDNSWMWYELHVTFSPDEQVVAHKPLPKKKPKDPKPHQGGLSLSEQLAKQFDDRNKPFEPTPPDSTGGKEEEVKFQRRGEPFMEVWLTGRILRVCYGIPEPKLRSIGGMEAIPANRSGTEYWIITTVSNIGVPVYAAMFRRRYILRRPPKGGVRPPGTPLAPGNEFGELPSNTGR